MKWALTRCQWPELRPFPNGFMLLPSSGWSWAFGNLSLGLAKLENLKEFVEGGRGRDCVCHRVVFNA